MSHVAEVSLEVRDLDALRVAVERCGGELMLGQRTHAWWGTWLNDWQDQSRAAALKGRDPKTFGQCDHAIRLNGKPGVMGDTGPWEVGVCAKPGGGFALVYDAFGRAGAQLAQAFGTDLSKLSEEYGAEVAMRMLARQGYRVTRSQVQKIGA